MPAHKHTVSPTSGPAAFNGFRAAPLGQASGAFDRLHDAHDPSAIQQAHRPGLRDHVECWRRRRSCRRSARSALSPSTSSCEGGDAHGCLPPDHQHRGLAPPFYVHANGAIVDWNPPDDEVIARAVAGRDPWEDYGAHRTSYPPGRAAINAALFPRLVERRLGLRHADHPGLIDILVPAAVMRGFPPASSMSACATRAPRTAAPRRCFSGACPILHGVV